MLQARSKSVLHLVSIMGPQVSNEMHAQIVVWHNKKISLHRRLQTLLDDINVTSLCKRQFDGNARHCMFATSQVYLVRQGSHP